MPYHPKNLVVACNLNELHNIIDKYQNSNRLNIEIDDINNTMKLEDIDLSALYNTCQHLQLTLKYIKGSQADFDSFFLNFSKFKDLKSFNFRFYNKQVQFLDALFDSLWNIETLILDFKYFRKINLKDDYADKSFSTKTLKINLDEAIIKRNSIQKFSEYIEKHENLQNLELQLDKQFSIDLLDCVKNKTNVLLIIKYALIKNQCDLLIKLVQTKYLDKLTIYSEHSCETLKEYLRRNGIAIQYSPKLNWDFYDKGINLQTIKEYDLQLMKQFPYLMDYLKEKSKQFKQKEIIIIIPNSFIINLLSVIDELFDSADMYSSYGAYLSKNQYYKLQKIKKFHWKIWIDNYYNSNSINDETQVIYLDLVFDLSIKLKHFAKNKIFKYVRQYEYLLQLKIPDQSQDEILKELMKIIKYKYQVFLSYLVFNKQIYDIIPVPKQVYYDLIDNS